MKTIDTAMPPSPDQIIQFMENKVIPHHEALTKLEAEKKSESYGRQPALVS